MKTYLTTIIITLFCLPLLAAGSREDEVNYEFSQTDTSYSFRGFFYISAEADSLMNRVFDFNHIAAYSPDVKAIERLQQGENWYDVAFTYRRFLVLEHYSTWRRTLYPDSHKIVFEMISSYNNVTFLPKMKASTGYYHFRPENGTCRVEYFQECRLTSGRLMDRYIKTARKEAIAFLRGFKQYLERSCVTVNVKGED